MPRPVVSRGRPLAASIVALVVGTVLVSTAVYFLVTFNGPPPMERPRRVESIAYALHTLRQPDARDRALILSVAKAPPAADDHLRANPAAAAALAARLGVPVTDVVALTDRRLSPRGLRPMPPPPGFGDDGPPPGFRQLDLETVFVGRFAFAWRDGAAWRVAASPHLPFFTAWHMTTLAAMLATIAALSLAAWALARAIARPLRQLARAAEQARAGATRPRFPGDGAAEVRALSAAVGAMHDRLAHHAEARTGMLAAIAHDLGTPLSRLAFWVEQLPDPARDRAAADIDEMRAMIADTLRFARDEAGERDATLVELSSLLDSLVEDMAVGGADIAIEASARTVVRGDPRALRRLFANLVGNAIRYGDRAQVRCATDGVHAVVTIADAGPGIDPAQAERLFEPFVRGDPSRNRATGGTGLGLAIVRSIAARHGGTATLANRDDAPGAIATVRLPLAR